MSYLLSAAITLAILGVAAAGLLGMIKMSKLIAFAIGWYGLFWGLNALQNFLFYFSDFVLLPPIPVTILVYVPVALALFAYAGLAFIGVIREVPLLRAIGAGLIGVGLATYTIFDCLLYADLLHSSTWLHSIPIYLGVILVVISMIKKK